MGCNRSNNVLGTTERRKCCFRNNDEDVLGEQVILVRGPGCISGTGECEDDVSGAGNSRRCCHRTNNTSDVLGTEETQNTRSDCWCSKHFDSNLITPTTVPR